ncbi:hypothetical protein BJF83_04720 [Nocardiopsis sp. CNR-923]|uniref:outer membrane protein assembly factor BamB family protein n=1 Tax=Nocardiopsis sp. CNR-923 TaxID=1904965 RepID=UPI0009628E10|nr:PQQ-binding-like beta-propeller repeat protein [Nocardiopsis sp. CNR-923]OLT25502.1 hypothetical protein BJF83_04720 [Nocardiopsis sp. CNR-923]
MEEFLAQEGLAEEVRGLLPTGAGLVALFDEQVVSFGAESSEEAWRFRSNGEISDVSVSSDGETILVQYVMGFGPWDRYGMAVLDARDGRIVESNNEWGVPAGSVGQLVERGEARVVVEGTRLVSRRISDGELVWENDLSESCMGGGIDNIDMVANVAQVFVVRECIDSGLVAVMGFEALSGDQFWEASWENPAVPRIHLLTEHTVPGEPEDPIDYMFDEARSGQFLFMDTRFMADGIAPIDVEPWRSAPGVSDHRARPLLDLDTPPAEIVFLGVSPADLNDRLVLSATISLAEDDNVPFTREDIDESLLIDGEFVENPRQWTTSSSAYVSGLEEALRTHFS